MNCFLVDIGKSLLLLDTNLPNSEAAFLNAAQDIGKPITHIALTHPHSDHAGSIDGVATHISGLHFAASARSAAYMQGDFSLPADDTGKLNPNNFKQVQTPVTQIVKDGDQFGPLKAVQTPGHTRDHFSWYDPRDGTFYSGDAWQSVGTVAVMGDVRWQFPFPGLITWDKQESLKSAARVLELKPRRLCTGHGKVVENALQVMGQAFKRAGRKFS
ncbi:MAG: MBL fold metallo-hydrolase [Chloroflexota bacterium]